MEPETRDRGLPVPTDELDWNQTLHEMMEPISVVTGHSQLLQRQILRADGLTNLERDLMLGNVAAVLDAMQMLAGRVEAWVSERKPSPDSSSLA
jgi:hypothetical protein